MSAALPLLLMNVLWVPAAVLAVLLLAYFPDGRLHGRGWRWVPATAAAAAGLLVVACAIDAWPTADRPADDAPAAVGLFFVAGGLLTLAALTGGAVSFVRRWRASRLTRRQFEAVGGVLILAGVIGIVTYPWPQVWMPLVHLAFGAFLLTYGIAIARLRVHDLEPVIGKGVLVAGVTVLAILVYLGIVVGVGHLVGARTDDPVLPLVAVALVALLAEPTRRVVRRGIDRMAYGPRSDRGEVLSHLTDRPRALDRAWAQEVVEMVRRATAAAGVELDIGRAPERRVAVGQPDPGPVRAAASLGEHGEIRIRARAVGDLFPESEQVLTDVAQLVTVLLDNERLTRDLADQLTATQESRQRLVEVHERARHELERDVHDDAQARLIGVRMRLGELARQSAGSLTDDLTDQLSAAAAQVDAAIRDLRTLAHGLSPPLLEQMGLAAALHAHVRDAALGVSITTTGASRHPRHVESAAYFTSVEAIQNALRHAGPATITVAVDTAPGALSIVVTDDGVGFDATAVRHSGILGLHDRVGALGGQALVESTPGVGTRVRICIPSQSLPSPPLAAHSTQVH